MKVGLVDYLGTSIVESKRGQPDQFNQGPFVPHFELIVERALQGCRCCRWCAAVHGRFVCNPSAVVRNEWRHSDTSVERIVHLLTWQPGSGPHFQATIRVEKGSQLHARAVYCCETLTADPQDGPWALTLISEQSVCDFEFPGQVQIVLSGKLPTPRESVSFGNGR